MQISDVGASLRRHWAIAVIILAAIPLVMTAYFINRDVIRPPARYTTSADILIPAREAKSHDSPSGVPPVLLQGQRELAISRAVKDVAVQAADLNPDVDNGLVFEAALNPDLTIMTLSVSAPNPELASTVLNRYIEAFETGRRQSVLDAAVDRANIEVRTVAVLRRKLEEVELRLIAARVALPPMLPDGSPLIAPDGAADEIILLLYQRNAVLNEMQRRQVDYSLQITQAAIPGDFTTVVQRRSAARITPPPPSPLIPLLQILGIGLLLALAVPVLMDRFDATITEARAAPGAFRADLLGTIPSMPRRLHRGFAPRGSPWEVAFRSLAATSISTDRLPTAIMVTGPVGSTQDSVAANFATALAGLGVTVALVGTVPRQDWFLDEAVDAEALVDADVDVDVYVDIDTIDEQDSTSSDDEPAGGDEPRRPWAMPSGPASPAAPGPHAAGDDGTTEEVPSSAGVTTEAPELVPSAMAPTGGGGTVAAGAPADGIPTFPQLLQEAQAGLLTGDLRARLATREVDDLYVVPPGDEGDHLALDGLPPLLDALARSGVDVTVLAGPALLEDPNATIIAWSTRNVLWALELGRVNTRDAQLAADRLGLASVAPFGIAIVKRHA